MWRIKTCLPTNICQPNSPVSVYTKYLGVLGLVYTSRLRTNLIVTYLILAILFDANATYKTNFIRPNQLIYSSRRLICVGHTDKSYQKRVGFTPSVSDASN